jgi:hypothetical protein
MQSSRDGSYERNVSEKDSRISKPAMLGLSTAVVVGVVMPLLAPHLGHPSMVFHAVLHLASLSIATFLSIVSILAYSRSRSSRLFFMMLGFVALGVVELLYVTDAAGIFAAELFSLSDLGIELPHIILLGMLCLFGLGVLKVNSK